MNPFLTPEQVRQYIRDGAIDMAPPGFDTGYGYSRIDVINTLDLIEVPSCGDSLCNKGEDQCNCPDDCGGTPPPTETNCADGVDNDCDTFTDCDDSDCACDQCPNDPDKTEPGLCGCGVPDTDCGGSVTCDDCFKGECDGVCHPVRDGPGCPDCAPSSSYCGDGTCEGDENSCSCEIDCGTRPSTETSCTDGIDNDCDGDTDCNDPDCSGDPACSSGKCGDGVCDDGEDCESCPNDCDGKSTGKPSDRYCCGNKVLEGPEGDGSICDGNYQSDLVRAS